MSKFSNFKINWPKSVEKLENGGRLGSLRQDLPPPHNDPLDPPLNEHANNLPRNLFAYNRASNFHKYKPLTGLYLTLHCETSRTAIAECSTANQHA